MAIISSNIDSMSGGKDVSTMKTYEDTYIVVADQGDNQQTILSNFADIGDTYPNDDDCTLRNKTCSTNNGGQTFVTWAVTLSWATGSEQITLAPWDRDPVHSWSTVTYQKEIQNDVNGKAIVSTNGIPFSTQTMKDDSRIELSIQKFLQEFDGTEQWELRDCLNDGDFEGAPEKTVKNSGCTCQEVTDDPIWGSYWSRTVSFQFDPEGWQIKRIAMGMKQLVGGSLVPCIVSGQQVNEPCCLDNNGKQLDPGVPPVILKFDVYNATDLSELL